MREVRQIVQTILGQIRLDVKMACGLRDYRAGLDLSKNPYMLARVGAGRKSLYVRITLNPLDYYDCELLRYSKRTNYEMIQIEMHENIDCMQLSECLYGMVNK